MDDKKLDEIMQEYLSTTVKGKKTDFKKVDYDNFKKKSSNVCPKTFICVATVLVIVITVMSIVLPIVFRDKGENKDNLFFADSGSLLFNYTNDKGKAFDQFDSIIVPTIDHEDRLYSIISLKESNNIIGLSARYGLYDDIYDQIEIYMLKKGYMLLILKDHLTLEKEFEWRGINVKYEIVENNMQYNCKICFVDSGYHYIINTVFYEPIDIQLILETIYG